MHLRVYKLLDHFWPSTLIVIGLVLSKFKGNLKNVSQPRIQSFFLWSKICFMRLGLFVHWWGWRGLYRDQPDWIYTVSRYPWLDSGYPPHLRTDNRETHSIPKVDWAFHIPTRPTYLLTYPLNSASVAKAKVHRKSNAIPRFVRYSVVLTAQSYGENLLDALWIALIHGGEWMLYALYLIDFDCLSTILHITLQYNNRRGCNWRFKFLFDYLWIARHGHSSMNLRRPLNFGQQFSLL